MTDNLKKRGGQDRTRIDVSQEHELRAWSDKLGVSPTELRSAVAAAGDRADKVEQHLKRGARKPARRDAERPG
jgi:hypothetical protein